MVDVEFKQLEFIFKYYNILNAKINITELHLSVFAQKPVRTSAHISISTVSTSICSVKVLINRVLINRMLEMESLHLFSYTIHNGNGDYPYSHFSGISSRDLE